MAEWVGVKKLAVVPTFDTQVDGPAPAGWSDLIMSRVLYDPDPVSGVDRSLRGYIAALSYGRATLEAKMFPPAFSDGPSVMEAAYRSLPSGHGHPYVLCVIPYSDNLHRKGFFRTVGENGVTAVARVAVWDASVGQQRQTTGVWAMEVLHAIAGFPDLYLAKGPQMVGFDNMMYCEGMHSCAHLKQAAGWLTGRDISTQVATSGDHILHSIGLGAPPQGRVAAVRVRTPGNTYLIEARLRSDVYERGFGRLIGGGMEFRGLGGKGVIVYETQADLQETYLMTPSALASGQSYRHPSGAFSVQVTGQVEGGMRVRVSVKPDSRCDGIRAQIRNIEEMMREETDLEILKGLREERARLRAQATRLGCP